MRFEAPKVNRSRPGVLTPHASIFDTIDGSVCRRWRAYHVVTIVRTMTIDKFGVKENLSQDSHQEDCQN